MVLWGTDNLKTEGGPIAQALWLMGAEPRFDSYGRLTGAKLVPLAELGTAAHRCGHHPIRHFSGSAAAADKTSGRSGIAGGHRRRTGGRKTSCVNMPVLPGGARRRRSSRRRLRVFGNADGAYGANVNQLVGNGAWNDEDELADAYVRRKGFAYGVDGRPRRQRAVLAMSWRGVDITYQNLDSIELGVTTVDHYFDTLGGISRAVRRARGGTASNGLYRRPDARRRHCAHHRRAGGAWKPAPGRSTRNGTRGLLKHGYEGVREIEAHVTNTLGWSATTGQVAPWVYQQIAETFVLDDGDARASGDVESDRFGQDRQPPDRSAGAQILVARRCDARGAAPGG